MPKFETKDEIIEIVLPVSKAKVKIKTKMDFGMALDYGKTVGQDRGNIPLLIKMIQGWDFTYEDGKEVPINSETISALDYRDGNFISEEIVKKLNEKK